MTHLGNTDALQPSACGALNPSWPAEPGRCTLSIDHEGLHVHEGRTATLTWGEGTEGAVPL